MMCVVGYIPNLKKYFSIYSLTCAFQGQYFSNPLVQSSREGSRKKPFSFIVHRMKSSSTLLQRPHIHKRRQLFGSPGMPVIDLNTVAVPLKFRSSDIIVRRTHYNPRSVDQRLLQYLGKHVPHPQKSLWSPDTPVVQDRHLFMLTTLDVDQFKYWFGVKRALVTTKAWAVISKSSLLPPLYNSSASNRLPKPIFDKEDLYTYFLAKRKDLALIKKEEYLQHQNSIIKSPAQRAAERPVAPFM
jgi:hypothetical protein